ncbi:hypothetical protein B9Z19DRAFT_473591 [Tuber borchii]|uniref:Uncharacterized protein n=1 Tax=Tuber borchii TaxID=42251 RepID=A0A2T6ZFD5_TUBBO|nr:hypothetical protein B9Z19DRAFT_473591 [Tuber borchii]
MISSTKAKPVPTSKVNAEIVAQYEIHKARMEEQQKINRRKRVERRAESNSIGGIGGWLSVISFFPSVFLLNLKICEPHFNVLILSLFSHFFFRGKEPLRSLFPPHNYGLRQPSYMRLP